LVRKGVKAMAKNCRQR